MNTHFDGWLSAGKSEIRCLEVFLVFLAERGMHPSQVVASTSTCSSKIHYANVLSAKGGKLAQEGEERKEKRRNQVWH